jgi:hypothetical protein
MSVDTSGLPSPIQGVCYQPAPLDYQSPTPPDKYWDSDFFNTDFPGFWSTDGGGRGDLVNMADLGVNFIHLYNWNAPPLRDHTTFLAECATRGISVAVPFNNAFCQGISSWGPNAIYEVMNEIYAGNDAPSSAVVMWTISNEYNQGGPTAPTPTQIAQVAQVIVYFEAQLLKAAKPKATITVLPIACPTSFAGTPVGIGPTQALQKAFTSSAAFTATYNGSTVTFPALPSTFFADRCIVATNPQNPGSIPPASAGVTIASFLTSYQTSFPSNPLWFSEIGIGLGNCTAGWAATQVPGPAQQAAFTSNQIASADPTSNAFLVGSSVFEYTPDYFNWGLEPLNPYTFALLSDLVGTSAITNFNLSASSPTNGSGGTVGTDNGQPYTYPVQCLYTSNPVYQSVRTLWNPKAGTTTSPSSFCPT